ncbi:acyltransferase ChoActase/COT/CPT [Conidiobolus coronatus NRRL 28638]|uniref:Acyltransferase ChoActase/COT/CPT n=1 Tax=Conidiobolus coronatus (strain ATCC 28846 / CBS 209.66 / NRRL 28638) TaxID=796925 RepID=A0A137PGT3_CONC2|nr:acyltransferase ChoActase/COT/CPT [Conidiobolus coronatus NRRL 28638]|eukprot:KXN74213.1 acyltransferase ChoActase/COT/CPT [Conidiobolus coronatus NRRL 28638]
MSPQTTKPKSTFHYQSSLPRLPIPKLEKTLERWLISIKPFATDKELEEAKSLAQDFLKPDGLGQKLQERLINYDKTQAESWLDKFWLDNAYLVWRDPSLINVNWGTVTQDHPSKPQSPPSNFRGFTRYQIARASHLIHHLTKLHESIINEEFPITKSGKDESSAICMNQYKKVFGVTRIPEWGVDRLEASFPCFSTHIAVLVQGQIFKLNVYKILENGERIVNSIEDIEYQLTQLIYDKSITKYVDFTHVTGSHRDLWTQFRQSLIQHDPTNLKSLQSIESALFSLSLDDYVVPSNPTSQYQNAFHGTGYNRWFDKSLNFIIDASGSLGLNGEHSPIDALVPTQLLDHCASQPFNWTKDTSNEFSSESLKSDLESWKTRGLIKDIHKPQHLEFKIPENLHDLIKSGQEQINKLISNSDSKVIIYNDYGSEFIKKSAKLPVDGYLQMVQQLNYYQLFGKLASVYETASIRKFKLGRTEAIRAASQDAKNFIQFANNLLKKNSDSISAQDYQKAYNLLSKACLTHRTNTIEASNGNGVDRHLLALRLLLRKNESHQIFQHPTFINSCKWDLSTSQLFSSKNLGGTGFGAVQPQGVGENYYHRPKEFTFTVECKRDNKTLTGGIKQWEEGLIKCLKLVKNIALKGQVEKSKL